MAVLPKGLNGLKLVFNQVIRKVVTLLGHKPSP